MALGRTIPSQGQHHPAMFAANHAGLLITGDLQRVATDGFGLLQIFVKLGSTLVAKDYG